MDSQRTAPLAAPLYRRRKGRVAATLRGVPRPAVPVAVESGWWHRHHDVAGGWLRPAVFGAVDGLATCATLVCGLAGAGLPRHVMILASAAALLAGAFAMGTGEYVSVSDQNKLADAETTLQRQLLTRFSVADEDELGGYFRGYGADPETAARMAAAASRDPYLVLGPCHRDYLGPDPLDLPSPFLSGVTSMGAFAAGALTPLLPYLLGTPGLAATLALAAAALVAGGMAVGRMTGRSSWHAGLRQLAFGTGAMTVAYLAGALISGRSI